MSATNQPQLIEIDGEKMTARNARARWPALSEAYLKTRRGQSVTRTELMQGGAKWDAAMKQSRLKAGQKNIIGTQKYWMPER